MTTGFFHKELASGRWFTLSLVEQLAHIGSEVHRAISWHQKGDVLLRDRALYRALELFDLTVADPRWRYRLKEILRTRESVCDLFYGNNSYNTSFACMEKYFFQFACAVQIKR